MVGYGGYGGYLVVIKKLLRSTLLLLLLVHAGLSDTSVSATPTSFGASKPTGIASYPENFSDVFREQSNTNSNHKDLDLADEDDITRQLKQSFMQTQNYKPGFISNFLGKANGVTQAFRHFSGSPPKENFWKKSIKFPLHALHAAARPIEWTREKLISLVAKPASSLIYHGTAHNIPWDKLNPAEEEMARAQIQQASGAATGWGLEYGSNYLVNKFGDHITNAFLGKIISLDGLPDQKNEHAYKNEIVKRIFARFEDHLPTDLQNGKAYEYYLQGKKFYGQAKLVYTLIDNITSALSLTYQFTTKAQLENPQLQLMQTKLAKVITAADIMRRCADSYLEINRHFKLDEAPENKNLKQFNRMLSIFSGIARFICPWRDAIASNWAMGKGMVQSYQASKQAQKTWEEGLVKRFGLREDDAHELYNAIHGQEDIIDKTKANKILLPYGLDISLVEQSFMEEQMQNLIQIMMNKYHMSNHDAQRFAQAESEDDAISLLQKYGINPQALDTDQELMALAGG